MEILSDVCDCREEDFITAIDGCGVPVHALPLYKLAQGYARMAIREETILPDPSQSTMYRRQEKLYS